MQLPRLRSRWPSSSSGALEADYEPEKYADGYRERVLELIQKKSEGEEIMVAEEAPVAASSHVVDLMAALEASVAAAKKARDRHPSAGDEMKPAAREETCQEGRSEEEGQLSFTAPLGPACATLHVWPRLKSPLRSARAH